MDSAMIFIYGLHPLSLPGQQAPTPAKKTNILKLKPWENFQIIMSVHNYLFKFYSCSIYILYIISNSLRLDYIGLVKGSVMSLGTWRCFCQSPKCLAPRTNLKSKYMIINDNMYYVSELLMSTKVLHSISRDFCNVIQYIIVSLSMFIQIPCDELPATRAAQTTRRLMTGRLHPAKQRRCLVGLAA